MNFTGIFLAFLVVLIWGINFPVIKFGLEELPPLLFSSLRFLIVAIPAIFFVPFPKTSIWNVLGVGVFLGVLKFGFLFVAMKADANAGISSLLLQSQVIFTIILSILIFKEKFTKFQALGILIAFLGFSSFFFSVNNNVTLLGIVLLICAGFFWSISNIIMKKMKGVNLLHFMVWVCLIPPLPLFLLSYFFELSQTINILFSTTSKTWIALLYVSFLSTLLAFAIWGWLLKTYNATLVTPFALLIPIVGIFSSSILLGEELTSEEIFGAIFILSGLFIIVFANKISRFIKRV